MSRENGATDLASAQDEGLVDAFHHLVHQDGLAFRVDDDFGRCRVPALKLPVEALALSNRALVLDRHLLGLGVFRQKLQAVFHLGQQGLQHDHP